MPSLRGPSLCLDILVSLFDLLHKPSDIAALSRTCRILNALGSKRLLGLGVELENDDALLSFCRYMLADLDCRGPQLRKLTISIETEIPDHDEWGRSGLDTDDEDWDTDSDDMEMEVDSEFGEEERKVLRGATRLEDLDIDYTDELLQRGGEDLRRALTSLLALRRLRTTTLGLSTLWVVRGMTAPLVELDLNLQYFNVFAFADIFDVLRLPAFQSSLRKITLWFASLGGRDFVWDQLEDENKPRFPHVHTLSVRGINHGIRLRALMDAFPNLRILDLTDIQPDGDMDILAEHTRNRTVSASSSWRVLRNLCGDTDALYALGLVRPVPRVDVSDVRLTHEGVARLHAVVNGTMPSRLLLHIDQAPDSFETYISLHHLFPRTAARWITHLALDFDAARGDSEAVWRMMSAFEDRGYAFLWPLTSLRTLVIRISDGAIPNGDWYPPRSPEPPCFMLGDTERGPQLTAYAFLILERFPSLVSVALDLADEELGPSGTSHSFKRQMFASGLGIVARTWKGSGPGDVAPWTMAQGMGWHRRLAYSELPEGY